MLDDYFNQYDGIQPPTHNSTRNNAGFQLTAPIYSPNGRFCLVFQGDGNLVLYDTQSNWRGVWDSRSWGRATTGCFFQGDGNLVIYNGSQPIWSSNTWGNPNAILSVEDNGRAVIYAAGGTRERWSTTNDNSTLF